jgi:hypothetical protein
MSDSTRAELGAQVAAAHAIALIRRHLDQGAQLTELSAKGLFREIAQSMISAARDRGLSAADVRTTLTAVVVPTYAAADGARPGWAGHVADTGLWLRCRDGWRRLTGETKSTFDGNALHEFLPHHPDAASDTWFDIPDGGAVGVLSDGIGDSFTEVDGAAHWFAERWRTPPPLASFMLDVDFEAKGQQDDRTAVVVWCRPAVPRGSGK